MWWHPFRNGTHSTLPPLGHCHGIAIVWSEFLSSISYPKWTQHYFGIKMHVFKECPWQVFEFSQVSKPEQCALYSMPISNMWTNVYVTLHHYTTTLLHNQCLHSKVIFNTLFSHCSASCALNPNNMEILRYCNPNPILISSLQRCNICNICVTTSEYFQWEAEVYLHIYKITPSLQIYFLALHEDKEAAGVCPHQAGARQHTNKMARLRDIMSVNIQ